MIGEVVLFWNDREKFLPSEPTGKAGSRLVHWEALSSQNYISYFLRKFRRPKIRIFKISFSDNRTILRANLIIRESITKPVLTYLIVEIILIISCEWSFQYLSVVCRRWLRSLLEIFQFTPIYKKLPYRNEAIIRNRLIESLLLRTIMDWWRVISSQRTLYPTTQFLQQYSLSKGKMVIKKS